MYSLTLHVTRGGPSRRILRRVWELWLNRHFIYRSTFDEVRGVQEIQPLAQFAWSELTASSAEELVNISKRERQAVWSQSDIAPASVLDYRTSRRKDTDELDCSSRVN